MVVAAVGGAVVTAVYAAIVIAETGGIGANIGVTAVITAAIVGIMGIMGAVIAGAGAAVGEVVYNAAMHLGRTRRGLAGIAGGPGGWAARYRTCGAGMWAARAMRTAARLMPRAAGERWLAEAESFLFEAPAYRAKVTRNYLITAPQVIVAGWTAELARRAKRPVTGRAAAKARRS